MTITPKKPVIMVVDDDEFIQKLLDENLNSEGFQVVLAGSYDEAMKTIARIPLDMCVIDIILPDKSGFELCRDLRKRPDTMDLPILILSSKHSVSDRVQGLKIGADDYLVKPFHIEELVARVHAIMRRKPAAALSPASAVVAQVATTETPQPVRTPPVQKPAPPPDPLTSKKTAALEFFKERLFEESLQIWEEIARDYPKDIDAKKYLEISRTQLMKKYLELLLSKDAIPTRTSNRPEDFVGLDFNTEEGFIFSRIDGKTDLKGIVTISGMKPLKAYGILYNFKKSGVIKLRVP